MRLRVVFGVVGELVRLFALAFIPVILVALRDGLFDAHMVFRLNEPDLIEAGRFLFTMCGTYLVGTFLHNKPAPGLVFRRSEAIAVVFFTWCAVSVVAAVPFVLGGIPPVDALFEAVSALTTTGATILQAPDWGRSNAFFFWRAWVQWLGGLGVIALFVVVLPRLGIAGRQIFFAEASTAPSDAVSPSVRGSARRLWALYISLTLMLTILLMPAGLGFFDALTHAFTAMSAGGFSNQPESVQSFHQPMVEWVMVPFLFLAGASFPLMLRTLTREPLAIFRDGELKLYLLCALSGIAALTFLAPPEYAFEHKLRAASFQVASLLSCAGFASEDYERWAPAAKVVILLVMAAGGCAGSTGGGAKQVRYLLVFKFLRQEITRVLHPRAVLPIRHGKEAVPQRVMWAVFMLVLLFLGMYVVTATLLMLLEHGQNNGYGDFPAAMGSSIACINNAGPGLGPAGPMGTFAGFTTASKLLLSAAMLIGRLEIVTVLALCHPHVWRNLSWGGGRGAKL